MTTMSGDWSLEFVDPARLAEVVDFAREPDSDAAHALDRLISILDESGALSRSPLGADPPWWEDTADRLVVWRLAEPTVVWRASVRDGGSELVVIRDPNDVLVVATASALTRPPPAEQLLTNYYSASKSEPYARADAALNRALRDVGGDPIDLGSQWGRDPLAFDAHFRAQPDSAMFDVGFDLHPMPVDRYLVRLHHLFDLIEDFRDRPLPRHDPIGYGELVALWSRTPDKTSTARPVVLVLLSTEDEPTKRLRPHLDHAADVAGWDLIVLFPVARYGSLAVDPAALDEQLERAWSCAAGVVKGLIVHAGFAFAESSSAYRHALAAFRTRHPEIRLATEALLGKRGGDIHGVAFDQPPELDPILEQLAF